MRRRELAGGVDGGGTILGGGGRGVVGGGGGGGVTKCERRRPDIMCLSKGLTAGYMPLGVTMTTRKVFDAFYVDPNLPENAAKTFFHGHTFTGHPLACERRLPRWICLRKIACLSMWGV